MGTQRLFGAIFRGKRSVLKSRRPLVMSWIVTKNKNHWTTMYKLLLKFEMKIVFKFQILKEMFMRKYQNILQRIADMTIW